MKPNAWRHKGEEDKEPLQYTECGLDDVYLVSGYETVETPYGEGVTIKNLDQLHRAIGRYLANEKKALSGKELRFLRKQMNLTQFELGKLLGLSAQQVARWEKGVSAISGPADLLLRAYYIHHVDGKVDLQTLVTSLEDIDSPMDERVSFAFASTAQGWKKAA